MTCTATWLSHAVRKLPRKGQFFHAPQYIFGDVRAVRPITQMVPGQDFVPSKLSAFDKEALKAVPKSGLMKMLKLLKNSSP